MTQPNGKKNRTFAESIRSLEREVPDEQNWFSINKIKEKIKKINEKSKGFTKLPTLENIYEKEPFTSQKRVHFSEGFETPFKTPKKKKDFADKEFEKEMEKLGFSKKSKSDMSSQDEKEYDPRCDDVNKTVFYEGEFVKKKGDSFSWKIIKANEDGSFNIQRDTADNDIESITNVQKKELYRNNFFNINLLEIIPNINTLPYVCIDYIIKKLGIGICDRIVESHNTIVERKRYAPPPPDKDKKTVISEIYNAIFLCLIIFMTYNWFFTWCYNENDKAIPTVPIFSENFGKSSSGKAYKFILEYYVTPLKYIDLFFTCHDPQCNSIPVYLNKLTSSPSLQWIIIFLILLSGFSSDITMFNSIPYMKEYVLQGNSSWLKDWMLGLSQGKDKSFILLVLLVISIIGAIFTGSKEDELPTGNKSVIVQTAESWGKMFGRLLVFIIQMLITGFLYPYICIYLFYFIISYAFFAMAMYPKFSFKTLLENLDKVNTFITGVSEKKCENDENCESFFQKILNSISISVKTFVNILLVSIPLLAINNYYNIVSLSSKVLKWGLIGITLFLPPLFYILFNKIIHMLKSMSGFNFGSSSGAYEEIDEYAMYGDGYNCDLANETVPILEKINKLQSILKNPV